MAECETDKTNTQVSQKPLAISLMGPTAAGKTDLAISLVKILNAEIISVDSALVYRGLDIGSAKPSAEEQKQAPHRLIDIRDPLEPYSAADFCKDAKREMADIIAKGKTPLLVGGSMMYFKALLEGLSDLPEADEKTRKHIDELATQHGWPHVHQLLAEVDPVSAEKIHPNHSQRINRAYEVHLLTGKPMSSIHGTLVGGVLDDFNWVQMAIAPRDRKLLHDRIALRYRKMLDGDFLAEVKQLHNRVDLHRDLPAIRSVGYRQVWEYLDGDYDYEEMVEKGIVATRQLAKRQLTWLRGWQDLNWLYTQDDQGNLLKSEEILNSALKFIDKRAIY